MKPPVTGIVLFSLAAGLVRAAGPPLAAPDLRWRLDSMAATLIPAAPAGGLVASLAALETALEKQ